MFTNSVLKEAISLLPILPESESLDDIRHFLRGKLHFNAEQTRQRYADYITRRMFPNGYADLPMRSYAKTFRETQEFRDVCFYRFLKAEPLEVEVVNEILIPNIGKGGLDRKIIRHYLDERFPSSRSVRFCTTAVLNTLSAAGIAKYDRRKVTFGYRDIPLAAYAFILHSEFSERGMYDISKLEASPVIRAMLWKPSKIIPLLYELRNRGIISKVSEIDNMRQFTTKWTLKEVVTHLTDGVEKV